jgi:transcription elongation factor GreA
MTIELTRELDELLAERRQLTASLGESLGTAAEDHALAESTLLQIQILSERIQRLHLALEDLRTGSTPEADDAIRPGRVITLRFEDEPEPGRYVIGRAAVHDDVTLIYPDSPLGRALIGARPGDVVSYQAPRGTLRVECVDVADTSSSSAAGKASTN